MFSEDLFKRDILSVSGLTARIRDLLEGELGQVWLAGEISNLRRPSSGHFYLTLKDESAQIRAVMFRNQQRYLSFEPEDGQEVLARGRLSVYEPRGEYQIILDYMEPRGEGALRLAFEKLKARLEAEGLFEQSRKKGLPFLPDRVAVVTSPTGAAIRDFIRVARRRFGSVNLAVYPVRVQGEGAGLEIAGAIEDLNRWGGFDVIVVTRGGGSLEDLWAFNEEVVARAVAASEIPVVSAVGHEVDFSICDFAADLRAPTPSAAAEIIYREKAELRAYLAAQGRRLGSGCRGVLRTTRERVSHLSTRLGDPGRALADRRLLLDDLLETLARETRLGLTARRQELRATAARLSPAGQRSRLEADRSRLAVLVRDLSRAALTRTERSRERLGRLAGRLGDLSPLNVLQRGYAVARRLPEGKALRSFREASPGDRLEVLLAEGSITATVDEVIS